MFRDSEQPARMCDNERPAHEPERPKPERRRYRQPHAPPISRPQPFEGSHLMPTKRLQPDRLFQRTLKGHTLYSHVVVASGKSLVFIAGQLARDQEGRIVGAGDWA